MAQASPSAAPFSALAIALFAALVLGCLAAPDLGYLDAGELGTASFVLGVPHPTGFALDMLLFRLGAMLPLGTIAWRQNVMVALIAAAALGLLFALVVRLAARAGLAPDRATNAGALLAVAGLGCWPTFLGTALAVEVYSTSLLLVALAGYGALRGGRHALLLFPAAGLAAGAHVTAAMMILPIGAALLLSLPAERRRALLLAGLPLAAVCALVVSYLPLASLRQPVMDWGDPETPAALLGHLTGARIRSSFSAEMLGGDREAVARMLGQLAELWPLFPTALLGLALAARKIRGVGLLLLLLLLGDLCYAVWIHPMGIEARQVGHLLVAVLALLSGLGAAALLHLAQGRRPAWRLAAGTAVFVLCISVAARVPADAFLERYAPVELHGSGGPLATLPPRAVLLCSSDDLCAGSLFAVHVEAVRPDLAVAPAQHLWDPSVLRRLQDLPALGSRSAGAVPPFEKRREAARAAVRALATRPSPRPLFWESDEPLRDAGFRDAVEVSRVVPFLTVVDRGLDGPVRQTPVPPDPVRGLDEQRQARFQGGAPVSERARAAWARAYEQVGRGALRSGRSGPAVVAMSRSTELTPHRAVAWTNLGVALQDAGDLQGAEQAQRRAIALDPARPTPWVNLARLALARGDRETARSVLDLSRRSGIEDPRLERLRQQLGGP